MKLRTLILVCVSCLLVGSTLAVTLNNGGLWPKWLGGNYVSNEGCSCQDYEPKNDERDFHWLICPIRSAWGWKDTGMRTQAIIHYDNSCKEHGHEWIKSNDLAK